ncbi:MAG: methyltransferase domain-containing protein [Candidatus Woesearchaeota archaeon]
MAYYAGIASGYEELHKEEQLGKLKVVLERLPYNKTDKVLDVGCGTGLSSLLFNCQKFGVDPTFELLQQAKQRMPVVQGVAEQLPFQDNSFDIVVCLTALHNFTDPQRALLEMKRVCTGKFAISILKRAKNCENLMKMVSNTFKVKEMIEDPKDFILFCE